MIFDFVPKEDIKRNKSVELDEKFKLPKELIKIAVNQKQSLILVGESGLGKTYLTLKTLKEMNLKNEDDFIFINSYLTPLALYKKLYEFRNKTIVLDDCENILTDNTSISILKSATFNSVGKKLVSYFSTTEKLEDTPTTFEFSGTLIILLNRIPRKCNYEVKSLIARCLNYDLKFSWKEKVVILYMMAKNLNIPSRIVDFIKANSSEAMELNFRTLIQSNLIFEYYRQHPSENNGRSWEIVVKELLFRSENSYLRILIDLENSGKSVEEQVKLWNEKTGLGRRSFFLYKKKVQKCN